ncbi:uncharacterized protein LOC107798777 [Nicotiana tabacum]|uniref:Uncharacterized protein LOC107798777 n=1 Tax=Nicotiana tabacum TaxID=4097 RepID=A0AC58TV80_TOBAC
MQSETTTPTTDSLEEQLQLNSTTVDEQEQCEQQGDSARKRKRGKTKMLSVHGRCERKLIIVNENNQPIGPTKDVVAELGSFLVTLARNASLCPLDIFDWRKMDTKEDLWAYTKEKYDIPDTAKKWTLDAIQAAWRRQKSNLKEHHFDAYANDEIRMQKRSEYIPASQFKDLLKYWNSEKFQRMSKTNIENRKQLKNSHTVGKKSFAIVRNELVEKRRTLLTRYHYESSLWLQDQENLEGHRRILMKIQLVKLLKWKKLKHNKVKMAAALLMHLQPFWDLNIQGDLDYMDEGLQELL